MDLQTRLTEAKERLSAAAARRLLTARPKLTEQRQRPH
jgi:hypothetical protein